MRAVASMPSSMSPLTTLDTRVSKVATSHLGNSRIRRTWNSGLPPSLRPVIRAYLLAYVSTVAPRILTLLVKHVRNQRRKGGTVQDGRTEESFVAYLERILRAAAHWQRFPAFCACLIGGSTLLTTPIRRILDRLAGNLSLTSRIRLSRWLSSFISGYLSLRLLQSKTSPSFTTTTAVASPSPPGVTTLTTRYAGRTLDLTLFAFTQALDIVIGSLWSRRQSRRRAAGLPPSTVDSTISRLTDPSIFAVSSGLIMWAWFYQPTNLPRSYGKWISSAAAVDERLIEALRRCRTGVLQYGKDTGQAPLLGGMAEDHGWPVEWGDPAVSIPFPCEMVHMGCGPSCEKHAVSRFLRSFQWAMATYLPLNLLLVARRPNRKSLITALMSAGRSSAFLGAFITLFYYGVCLSRTRVGPKILGTHTSTRQLIDGGVCVGTGCFLCGWSILLERAGRRKDMALFVAPRALATLLPRRYALDKQWRETVVFAASWAVVLTCVMENKRRVRGVLGGVLSTVLEL